MVPVRKPKDDGYPERCGDDGVGSCHRSTAGSSVQWLWSCAQLRETLLLVISPSLSFCQQTREMQVSCSHLVACFCSTGSGPHWHRRPLGHAARSLVQRSLRV